MTHTHTHWSSTVIDNTSIVTVSTLLDADGQIMVPEMKGVSGIPKTMIHHILTKYLMKERL